MSSVRHPTLPIRWVMAEALDSERTMKSLELSGLREVERTASVTGLDQFAGETLRLEALLQSTALSIGFPPPWEAAGGVPFILGRLYYSLVRALKPEVIIETGVASGVSSSFLLAGLSENSKGTLYSIDLPYDSADMEVSRTKAPDHRATTQGLPVLPKWLETGWIVPGGLRSRWKLFRGRSNELLPAIRREVEPDIFIHDSDHSDPNVLFELNSARAIGKRQLMIVDDVWTGTAFLEFCQSQNRPPVFFPKTLRGFARAGVVLLPRD